MKQINNGCPTGCICVPGTMHYTKIDDGEGQKSDMLTFVAKVDCSNLTLTKLPPTLPENTVELKVSNNSISSLSALASNDYYQNIRSLYADDNLITSITDLEGTKFLENFTILSLQNNKIKDIPFYILVNLEKNSNGKVCML